MRNGFIALDPRLSPPTTAIRQTKNGLVTLLCDSTGHPESRFPLVDCDQFRYVIRPPESLIGDDLEITNLPVNFYSEKSHDINSPRLSAAFQISWILFGCGSSAIVDRGFRLVIY